MVEVRIGSKAPHHYTVFGCSHEKYIKKCMQEPLIMKYLPGLFQDIKPVSYITRDGDNKLLKGPSHLTPLNSAIKS